MSGVDTFTESLFTIKKLENYPLRAIRTMVNQALSEMNELFDQMYAEDILGADKGV